MEVDRSRFLLLTAALALAACKDKAETKADEKAEAAPAEKAAEPEAKEAEKQEPEPEPKEFGIKGAPESGADSDALPPIEDDPEWDNVPSPVKE